MIKRRNYLIQILLTLVTFGLYIIYWFHVTYNELRTKQKTQHEDALLWTIFMFIPLLNFVAMYKYSSLYEEAGRTGLNRWIIFILWIFLPLGVWLIVQGDLNKYADEIA